MGTKPSKPAQASERRHCIQCGAALARRRRKTFTGYCGSCYRSRPIDAKAGGARALTPERRIQLTRMSEALGAEGRLSLPVPELLELLAATLPLRAANDDVEVGA